ncbi:MAG: NIPSNAP family protein [Acidimicrobiales bacterium]|nr:NIPSNAP family protein [Acidimicrobiales bacterium]|tara:strand:- start:543 stop:971 length:429 start_codon:yes stop_codon:yes gene_type:complete
MLKWKIIALGGILFGLVGAGWAIAEQQRTASQVFELRVYKTMPGKRETLANRFRDHTSAMFERAGMKNVGYFNAITGDDTDDTFVYLLAYPSREARDDMWRELGTYEDFQELIVQVERDDNRKLVDTIDARLLVPTSYSELK